MNCQPLKRPLPLDETSFKPVVDLHRKIERVSQIVDLNGGLDIFRAASDGEHPRDGRGQRLKLVDDLLRT